MKTLFTFLLLLFSLFVKGDYWTRKADFGGTKRSWPFTFVIGNKGYIGCGMDLQSGFGFPQKSFWEYDPAIDIWTQKTDFPGAGEVRMVAFSILNKGYAGLGYAGQWVTLKDFWKYDPAINAWTRLGDFPGVGRIEAVTFVFDTTAYITTGGDSISYSLNDVWQYNPVSDSWLKKNNFPGMGRGAAVGFAIGGKGYLGTGTGSVYLNDFWEYNPLLDSWTQKATFISGPRYDAAAFSIGNYGYLGIGTGTTVKYQDFIQYNPMTNQWYPKANFPGMGRTSAAFFSIGNKGYIGLGDNVISVKDFYEYTPDSTTAINEPPSSTFQFQLSPNPAHQVLVVGLTPNPSPKERGAGNSRLAISIIDINGKKVFSSYYEPPTTNYQLLDVSGLAAGIYFVEATNGSARAVKKFLKE